MTEERIGLLRKCFAEGCTDKEACLVAEISQKTLSDYQRRTPGFAEEKENLKALPIFKARKIINNALDKEDLDVAKWFLERKKKDEFALKQPETNINFGEHITIDLDSDEPQPTIDVTPDTQSIEQATDDTQHTKDD